MNKPTNYSFRNAVDLTHELRNGMTIYPGDPKPRFASYSTIKKDGVNLTKLMLGSHTGTHIDAPRHFIPAGIGIDRIPPKALIAEAIAIDLSNKPIGTGITAQDLRKTIDRKVARHRILAIYTGCSDHWDDLSIRKNYTHLTKEAAEYLVSKKLRAVGIDFLSVEKFGVKNAPVHKTLLRSGVFIIESISREIKRFVGKRFLMVCLPIKLQNGDGAPARIVGVPIIEH